MDPPSPPPCNKEQTDMEIKARELGKARALRSYIVVLKEIVVGCDGKPTAQVRSICFTAPSWSHVAAKYDRPEDGVEIMKQEFLAPGEVSVMPLAWKAKLSELIDLTGLNMCYNCQHDFRNNAVPGQQFGRCTHGHRVDGEPADRICKGFAPKAGVCSKV